MFYSFQDLFLARKQGLLDKLQVLEALNQKSCNTDAQVGFNRFVIRLIACIFSDA